MVGVRGKYKGCETCRLRRVTCDNTKPVCNRCTRSGRKCQGYEKETVFVIATQKHLGRCSLQPRRVMKPRDKQKGQAASSSKASASRAVSRARSSTVGSGSGSSSKGKEPERASSEGRGGDVVNIESYQTAWDATATVSRNGATHYPQFVALHVPLDHLLRTPSNANGEGNSFSLSVPSLTLPDYHWSQGEAEFQLRAQCMLHLSPNDGFDDFFKISTESLCLFLYQQNSSVAISNDPPWKLGPADPNPIRRLGPSQFRDFPAHHFFVRVYRPSATYAALFNRKPTFLESPEWTTTPWEVYQKTPLDALFDLIVLLPSLLHRADRILGHAPTKNRRLMAQDLLGNCQNMERQFKDWHDMFMASGTGYSSAPASAHSSPRPQPSRSPTPSRPDPSVSLGPSVNDVKPPTALPEPRQLLLTPMIQHYWIDEEQKGLDGEAQPPFPEPFAFRNGDTALALVHYWTSQILLCQCISQLNDITSPPMVAQYPAQPQMQPRMTMGVHSLSTMTPYNMCHMSQQAYPIVHPGNDFTAQAPAMAQMLPMQAPMQHQVNSSQMAHLQQMPQLQSSTLYSYASHGNSVQTAAASNASPMSRGAPFAPTAPTSPPMTSPSVTSSALSTPTLFATSPPPMHSPGFVPTNPLESPNAQSFSSPSLIPQSLQLPSQQTPLKAHRPSAANLTRLAINICRSLNFALTRSSACLQPDALAPPLAVVENFWKERSQEAELEVLWCDWFREKINERKDEIAQAVSGATMSGIARAWEEGGNW